MAADESTPRGDNPIAAYYDRLAPIYGDGAFAMARCGAVIGAIASELRRARSLLDLGCGNGAYLAEFAAIETIECLVGADLSPEMLTAARRRPCPGALLVRADAAVLPFAARSFDVVFMSHVLMLVTDSTRCVSEAGRCLAPGGVLIATVGVGGMREILGQVASAEQWRALMEAFVPRPLAAVRDENGERYRDACQQAGLRPRLLTPAFTVDWPALEEWVRIRWLSIADDAQRIRAEDLLAQLRPQLEQGALTFHEPLLVAEKIGVGDRGQ